MIARCLILLPAIKFRFVRGEKNKQRPIPIDMKRCFAVFTAGSLTSAISLLTVLQHDHQQRPHLSDESASAFGSVICFL